MRTVTGANEAGRRHPDDGTIGIEWR